MKIDTTQLSYSTSAGTDMLEITGDVQSAVKSSGINEGAVLLFVPGSTAGLTTIEYEPGLQKDYPAFFERIAPQDQTYEHNNTWHDGNGHSHVRASIQGPSLTVPFKDGELLLGTWQQIILLDFDNKSRSRKLMVQISGV